MGSKGSSPKMSVARDESLHRRHFKVGFVGNGFEPHESNVVGLGGASYGCGFHVNRMRPVGLRQLGFLLDADRLVDADQDPMPYPGLNTASIFGVDDANWSQHRARFQSGIQGTGKAGRLHQERCIQIDDGLGRSSRCFRADAAADQHGTVVLEEFVLSAVVIALDRAPLFDQRAHLALEGADDGDFGGVRQC